MGAAEGLGLQDLGVCLVCLLSVTSCASQVLYLLCDTWVLSYSCAGESRIKIPGHGSYHWRESLQGFQAAIFHGSVAMSTHSTVKQ